MKRRWLAVAVIAMLAVGAGFLVFFATNPVRAAGVNFYVNAGTGNDSWNGTSPTYVSGTVGPKKTVQSCIAAAGAGDIVNVAAGTYTETGQILINKDLSIVGVDRDTTILKPAEDTVYRGAWILVNSGCNFNLSKVTLDCAGRSIFYAVLCNGTGTIDGCLITNVRWAQYYGFGVAIRGGYMTVSNNIFSNIERVSTYVARDGVTPQPAPSDIIGNSYTGKGVGDWLDYAVEVGRGALANITNNTIHNNVGVAAVDGSTSAGILVTTYYAPGTGAVITGNTITGNYIGIAVGYDAADTSTVTAHQNNLEDNPGGGMISTAPPVDAAGNWWGTAYKPSILSHFTGPITFEPYAVNAAGTVLNLPLPTPVFVDLSYTDGSAGGHIFGYDAFNNLKDGISGVVAGGTLNAAAGTYNEYFHISKSMTMVGTSGAASTIIHGGDPYSVFIEATDVTFTGFTVENPDYDGASDASGIVIEPPWGTPSNIHVYNNVVRDIGKITSPSVTYGRVGINIAFPYGPVEVDHNEIYNVWHSDSVHEVWANGICVWGASPSQPGTDVDIHDNTIHDVYCPKPRAAGISTQTDVKGIKIRNNIISDCKDFGIETRGGSQDSTLIQNNQINGAVTTYGISTGIKCSDPHPASVTGNTITACQTGILAADPEAGWGDPAVPPVVHQNRITANAIYNLQNTLSASSVTDATANWWGTAYKPTIQSKISTGVNVTFEPYYVDSAMTILNLPLPTPVFVDLSYTDGSAGGHIFGYDAFNKLQDGINGVAVEGTVNAAAGIYNEYFHINKSLTMVGTSGAASTIIHGGDPYSVFIEATGVTFTGFTVENPGYTGGSDASGIVIEPPTGSPSNIRIHDNVIRDIGDPGTACYSYGRVGINIGGPDGPVEVDHNEIYNIKHTGSTGDVWADGFSIWGAGPTQPANNVDIHDNYIHDIYCPEPKAAGISTQADVKGLKIRNNRIENTKDLGIETRGGSQDSTLIEGNQITGSGSPGIVTGVRCSDPFAADVTGNTITACNVGVKVEEHDSTWGGSSASVQPDVHLNRIAGNTAAGLSNELASGTTPATKNWWGNMYGPTNPSNPHGTGDVVTGPATFDPWCTDSALAEIVSHPAQVTPIMAFPGLFAIPVNATEASTPYLKAVDAVTVSVTSGSATHTIVLPTGTSMTPSAGGNINTGDVLAAYVSPSSITGFEPGAVVRAGVQWGLDGATLQFSSPISVRLYVGPGLEGNRLNIYRSMISSSGWTGDGIVTVSPPVSGGFVDFQATKASYYAAVSPPKGLPSSFYFAEGYTGPGFVEYLTLGNPNTFAATVDVTYMFPDGSTQPASYSVPAQSRLTVDVNSIVGPGREVSMEVLSAATNIVAERPMYFDYTNNGTVSWTGGHDVMGAAQAGRTWYFAEGYTGPGFDEYVCVLNPGGTKANLTFNFQTEEAGLVVKSGYSVGAHSRSTFKVNEVLGSNYQTSLKLESDQPVVAERPMYFNYTGVAERNWTGGSCVMGASALAKRYYFAEGSTRNSPRDGAFEEWLTLQNPGASPITINATYQLGQGQGDNVNRSYVVQPGRRATVLVQDQIGTFKDVSVLLTSTADFLAERPMYFNYAGVWTGGHCVIGSTKTGTRWFFAEGYTGQNFDQWLCIQNPGGQEATIQVTYFTQESGPVSPRTVKVPAYTRVTVLVNENAGPDYSLSTQLVSDRPVVVERPMYFNYNAEWTGGHDVVGHQF